MLVDQRTARPVIDAWQAVNLSCLPMIPGGAGADWYARGCQGIWPRAKSTRLAGPSGPWQGRLTAVEEAARILQLIVNGAASGCIYGLVALGFVLIYKATEMVNFAQGDIMMLGGFAAFTFITWLGLPYWIGGLLAIIVTAAFGYLLDAVVLRRVIGQPQFAVVMLTLGLGFIFRAAAGITWGYDSVGFN